MPRVLTRAPLRKPPGLKKNSYLLKSPYDSLIVGQYCYFIDNKIRTGNILSLYFHLIEKNKYRSSGKYSKKVKIQFFNYQILGDYFRSWHRLMFEVFYHSDDSLYYKFKYGKTYKGIPAFKEMGRLPKVYPQWKNPPDLEWYIDKIEPAYWYFVHNMEDYYCFDNVCKMLIDNSPLSK